MVNIKQLINPFTSMGVQKKYTGARAGIPVTDWQLLQRAYIIIAKRWGIYQGKSHMPYNDTEIFHFNRGTKRYRLTHYPNSWSGSWQNKVISMTEGPNEAYPQRRERSEFFAAGEYNYAAPWLTWFMRITIAHEADGDSLYLAAHMYTDKEVESFLKSKGFFEVYGNDDVRIETKRWLPRDYAEQTATTELERVRIMDEDELMEVISEDVQEYDDTGVTYFTLQEIGPALINPSIINWPISNEIGGPYTEYTPRFLDTYNL